MSSELGAKRWSSGWVTKPGFRPITRRLVVPPKDFDIRDRINFSLVIQPQRPPPSTQAPIPSPTVPIPQPCPIPRFSTLDPPGGPPRRPSMSLTSQQRTPHQASKRAHVRLPHPSHPDPSRADFLRLGSTRLPSSRSTSSPPAPSRSSRPPCARTRRCSSRCATTASCWRASRRSTATATWCSRT